MNLETYSNLPISMLIHKHLFKSTRVAMNIFNKKLVAILLSSSTLLMNMNSDAAEPTSIAQHKQVAGFYQYPLGHTKNGEVVTGIYAARTHEVIPMKECKIQNPISEQIATTIVEFLNQNKISVYNEKTGKGLFRHIVIKVGENLKRSFL